MSKPKPSGLSEDPTDTTESLNFDSLPKEILAEIMSRLSPKSLMQLKCLNKYWYFVIKLLVKDPEFVAKHLQHSQASPRTLFVLEHTKTLVDLPDSGLRFPEIFFNELVTSFFFTPAIEEGNNGYTICVTEDVNVPSYPILQKIPCLDAYHCNGVICLANDRQTLVLYNPALCESDMFNLKTDLVGHGYEISAMGFGSDTTALNFKVVRLLNPMKAEVFTLGSATNSWRAIDVSIPDEQYCETTDHVYSKGNCFWLMPDDPGMLLCFDVCNEVFHTVPLPIVSFSKNTVPLPNHFWKLSIRNDSVCVLHYDSDCIISVWAMDVGGCNYSWIKSLRIELKKTCRPLTFWNNDELLVVRTRRGVLASCNLRTQKLRSLYKLVIDERYCFVLYSGIYVMSLVSIKGMNRLQ